MAENTSEDSGKSMVISSTSEITLADDKTDSLDEKENHEQMDIDKPSTSREGDAAVEKEKNENENVLSSEEQQDAPKSDCNGDLEEETSSDKACTEMNLENETEAKESEMTDEVHSIESDSSNEPFLCTTAVQSNLNEILQIVHGDLATEILQSVNKSAAPRGSKKRKISDEGEQSNSKEKKDDVLTDESADSVKECTTSANVNDDKEAESMEKTEETSNLEIVRSPTAIGELIEEQLACDSTLSADRTDHIVEWVKNSVKANADEQDNTVKERKSEDRPKEPEKRKASSVTPPFVSPRKSQKLVIANYIVKKSIKCLNKNSNMHAMEGTAESRRKVDTAEDDKTLSSSSSSQKVPQNQQNGAALPEETAAAPTTSINRGRTKKKDESRCDTEIPNTKDKQLLASTSQQSATTPSDDVQPRRVKASSEPVEIRKRKNTNGQSVSPGVEHPRKKFRDNCTREEYISRIVDSNESVEELMAKADKLRADILALENLAHAKEMEWNEILRKRKLKEEAYLRLERKIQTTVYLENEDGQLPPEVLPEALPPARSSLDSTEWENNDNISVLKEKSFESKEDLGEKSSDSSGSKKEKPTKASSQQRVTPPKTNGESNRKQNDASSPESRQIGEGRQGAIVDVRSIIADHRLKHPETVPRRGRRMRNSNVNINLGAGGAMVETGHNADSRPSSTESCKSNSGASDTINYKDMLVHFAKITQQGETIKVPQNYPDVTLHPVTPSAQSTSQPTGSLLHGILTKAQTPRSTTFSPTLARLLTAPERERNSPTTAATASTSTSMSQQSATTQHLLQTYQGSSLVSINDLLSSSKARTEITITPVVNTSAQSHSNDLIQVEDVEEETTIIEDRKGNSMVSRDGKQIVKDNPPSPNAAPKCQGCIIRPAQFVCAGCGNQWYCSRTCQLAAWATHSDHCPPEPENNKTKINV